MVQLCQETKGNIVKIVVKVNKQSKFIYEKLLKLKVLNKNQGFCQKSHRRAKGKNNNRNHTILYYGIIISPLQIEQLSADMEKKLVRWKD